MLDAAGSGGRRQSARPWPRRSWPRGPPPPRGCALTVRAIRDPPVLPANKERGQPPSPAMTVLGGWGTVSTPAPSPAGPSALVAPGCPRPPPGTACPSSSRAAEGCTGSTAAEGSCLGCPAWSGFFPEMEPSRIKFQRGLYEPI